MKLLVTGGSSLPGFRVVEEALARGHKVVALHYTHEIPLEHERLRKVRMDITDRVRVQDLIFKERPEAILHIAALGDVDLCEKDRALAWRVNVMATVAIARAAEVVNAHVIYLSTDYVFDGERGMYAEDEPPCPVNYYGLTKMAAEVAVRAACSRWSVVRTSSIYGLGPGRRNFAKFLIERLSRGEPVKALVDQYTSPTHARLLAKALLEVAERHAVGIFHVAGERMSRLEFALRVAEELGFDKSLISGARMSEFKWLARRPRDSSLDCSETRKRISIEFHDTGVAMEELRGEWGARGGA